MSPARTPRPSTSPPRGEHAGRLARPRLPAALVALLAAACSAPPEAGPPSLGPAARASVRHVSGSPLLGPARERPAADAPDDELADAWSVHAVVRAVERRPRAGLTVLADAAEFIADVQAAAPFRAVAGPTRGTAFVVGPTASTLAVAIDRGEHGARRIVETLQGALPEGVTVTVDVQPVLPSGLTADGRPVHASASVQLHRPAHRATDGMLELAVGVTTEAQEREFALVRLPPLPDTGLVAVLVPWPVTSADGAALLVTLEIGPPPEQGSAAGRVHALTLTRCAEELAAQHLPPVDSDADALTAGLVSALRGLLDATPPSAAPDAEAEAAPPDTAGQRGTLAYLAGRTGAALAQDVALSGAPPEVDALARAVLGDWSARTATGRTRGALGATLERQAWRLSLDDAGLDEVPPEREALRVLHAGEVGRNGALLEELLADGPSLDELDARLVAENIVFLDHGAPSSRTRAYDWLARRGRAPEGYDPFASREARRAALEAAGMSAHP